MVYFSFISHVRAALFFNVLEKLKHNSESLIQFVSEFYFNFISHERAA